MITIDYILNINHDLQLLDEENIRGLHEDYYTCFEIELPVFGAIASALHALCSLAEIVAAVAALIFGTLLLPFGLAIELISGSDGVRETSCEALRQGQEHLKLGGAYFVLCAMNVLCLGLFAPLTGSIFFPESSQSESEY